MKKHLHLLMIGMALAFYPAAVSAHQNTDVGIEKVSEANDFLSQSHFTIQYTEYGDCFIDLAEVVVYNFEFEKDVTPVTPFISNYTTRFTSFIAHPPGHY